ncbi:MAG: hypothetical protein JJU12_08575 [Chlamydiales bacterium]|nr:hypothetical protein [Chlamydiales bacterium]
MFIKGFQKYTFSNPHPSSIDYNDNSKGINSPNSSSEKTKEIGNYETIIKEFQESVQKISGKLEKWEDKKIRLARKVDPLKERAALREIKAKKYVTRRAALEKKMARSQKELSELEESLYGHQFLKHKIALK